MNKKVKLRLTNKSIIANLFYLIFKPVVGELDILIGEDRKVPEAIRS